MRTLFYTPSTINKSVNTTWTKNIINLLLHLTQFFSPHTLFVFLWIMRTLFRTSSTSLTFFPLSLPFFLMDLKKSIVFLSHYNFSRPQRQLAKFSRVSPFIKPEILPTHHQNHENTLNNMSIFNTSLWKAVMVKCFWICLLLYYHWHLTLCLPLSLLPSLPLMDLKNSVSHISFPITSI